MKISGYINRFKKFITEKNIAAYCENQLSSNRFFWSAFAVLSAVFTVTGYLICVAVTAIIF